MGGSGSPPGAFIYHLSLGCDVVDHVIIHLKVNRFISTSAHTKNTVYSSGRVHEKLVFYKTFQSGVD